MEKERIYGKVQAVKIFETLGGKQSDASHWKVHCPAHDDETESLSMTIKNGKLLLYCHAGCSQENVIHALKEKGLWNGSGNSEAFREKTEYDYTDETGKLLYQAVRRYRDGKKSFYQRRSNPAGGYINNITDIKPVIYNLPAVVRAVKDKQPVFILEGEKDADRLKGLGYTATCNSGGAGKWHADHAAYLKGADVYLIGDYDIPGERHIKKVFDSLQGVAKSVKVIDLGFPITENHGKDVSDWLGTHSKKEFEGLISNAGGEVDTEIAKIQFSGTQRKTLWSTKELLEHEFPVIPWIIEGFITQGVSILYGPPKVGKSWLALSFATALSVGGRVFGKIKVEPVKVLYLALEDNPRRLKNRIEKIEATGTDNCLLATEWKRGSEGIEQLKQWMHNFPDTKLVIIDTWIRFTAFHDGNDYSQVTDAAAELKKITDEYEIALLLIHHSRKAGSVDFLDKMLGSTAFAAVADTSMFLERGRGKREAVLSITGRDVQESEYAMRFDSEIMTWELLGEKSEVQESTSRQEIYDLLSESEGLSPKKISGMLEKNYNTVKSLLRKMVSDGAIVSEKGVYKTSVTRKPCNPVTSNKEIGVTQVTQVTQVTLIREEDEPKPWDDPPDLPFGEKEEVIKRKHLLAPWEKEADSLPIF